MSRFTLALLLCAALPLTKGLFSHNQPSGSLSGMTPVPSPDTSAFPVTGKGASWYVHVPPSTREVEIAAQLPGRPSRASVLRTGEALPIVNGAATLSAAAPAGYRLAWSDEFDGTKLNTEKWAYRTDSKHWSTQLPANVTVENGSLVLHLRKEKSAGKEYTGAGVISRQPLRFGYYETRFRILAGKGWHSSFWMMGHDGSGGTGTAATALELDVIENDSIDLTSYGVNTHKWKEPHVSYGHRNVKTASLSEFHIFGCEYTPTEVKYLLDGEVVQTTDLSQLPHGDLNIWLTSIASQLGHTDAVDETRLPGRVEFQYVRFYEKAAAPLAKLILVEAEGFRNRGGWSVDAQFQDQMGSPFLLAHGQGVPVADATTESAAPQGDYRVWVRTRDWVARWKAPGAPGKFQLLVDGLPLKSVFGTEGAEWHWQDGGTVHLRGGKTQLALHDLTGFDGRCDAILLSADLKWTPPEGRQLTDLRKRVLGLPDQPVDAGKFDLVVVGGGMAGTSAAVAAARLGLKVALIHDRPVLGGNSSSEVRVYPGGRTMLGPYPGLGAVEHELDPGSVPGIDKGEQSRNAGEARLYADEKKLYVVESEKNIQIFLDVHASGVEKSGSRIAAIVGREALSGRYLRFTGTLFADCTGDGTIGFLAGADYRAGREGKDESGEDLAPEKADTQVMGSSYMWYAEEAKSPVSFPEVPWALEFNERTAQYTTRGDWDWEVGMRQDQIAEAETIRDHAYRAIYGNWSFLKNHASNHDLYARQHLSWVAFVAGKRESRRLLGDVILKQQDLQQRVEFPDAAVSTTWGIDLHYPAPQNSKDFPGGEFRSIYKSDRHEPYSIPYRCFYSRNVENLFMAGRDISVTHVMLGTVRVQRTTAMMGELVGMAASVCVKSGTTPRGVYQNHMDDLRTLMKKGVGKEEHVALAAQLPLGFSSSGEWKKAQTGLRTSSTGAVANWKPAVTSRMPVRIWFHLAPDAQGDHAATVEVFHNGFQAVRHVNLAEGEARWVDLGVFQFSGNPIDCVRLVSHTPGTVLQAGPVKFELLRGDAATVRTTLIVAPE